MYSGSIYFHVDIFHNVKQQKVILIIMPWYAKV